MDKSQRAAGGFKPAIQNFGQFIATKVKAQSRADNLQLGPGYYSLSVLGNVPFVQLVGAGRQQKIFSWGEVVAIPEGQQVTVFNASFHGGDIVINGGQDVPSVPRRITVPVTPTITSVGTSWQIDVPPVDTRRARQVYWMYQGATGNVNATRIGKRVKGSHDTFAGATKSQWTDVIAIVNGAYIPMGFLAPGGLLDPRPMTELDTVELSVTVAKATLADPTIFPMYYTVEY